MIGWLAHVIYLMATNETDGAVMLQVGGLQNKEWAQDTSKFGYKMLMKMGWSAGKGLGRELDGRASHVVIKKRSVNLGIGCDLKQAEVTGWSNTSKGFADVLAELNQAYGSTKEEKEKKKKAKKEKKDKKAKKAKKAKKSSSVVEKPTVVQRRILYHKRLTNKNAKGYSEKDMTAILGDAANAW